MEEVCRKSEEEMMKFEGTTLMAQKNIYREELMR